VSEDHPVYPKVEPGTDKAYNVLAGIAGLFPSGQSVLNALITSPVQKRLEDWILATDSKLIHLEQEGINLAQAFNDRELLSALSLRCCRSVGTTSQPEKLTYLQNFLINAVKYPTESDDLAFILHDLIDQITPSHVKVLHLHIEPVKYAASIPTEMFVGQFESTKGDQIGKALKSINPEFWDHIFKDLTDKYGLLTPGRRNFHGIALYGTPTKLGLDLFNMIQDHRKR
jgi:hypothetical protein